MASSAWPRPLVLLVVFAGAVAISAAGALVWSRTVADGGDGGVDARLDEPGAYVEPGTPTNPPLHATRLPDVDIEAVDGSSAQLAPDGRPMVVNLWYSTCPPCARELAGFAAVHADVGDGVRFVGVDPYDTVDVMQRFAADRGVTYELWRDPEFEFTDALGIATMPVTLFVAADGTVVDQSSGALAQDELRQRLAELFGVGA